MNVIRSLTIAALFLLPLIVVGPPTDAFTPATALSGVFLRTGESGTMLGFGPMTEGEGSSVPIQTTGDSPAAGVPAVCVRAPTTGSVVGACTGAVLGIANSPATFAINGTGGISLWLSTKSPTPIALLAVTSKLQHVNGNAEVSDVFVFQSHRTAEPPAVQVAPRAEAGGPPVTSTTLTLTGTPTRISMADVRSSPSLVFAGEALTLTVELITPVSGPADLGIVAHFGPSMPSGVVFELEGPAPRSVRLGTTTLPILAQGANVTFHPLGAETTESKAFPSGAPPAAGAPSPPTTTVTGSTLTFGPTKLDEGTFIVGDGLVEFFVGTAEGAAGPSVDLAFDVKVTIGDKVFNGVTNTAVHQPTQQGTRFVAPIRAAPGLVLAGENVTLAITIFATKTDNFRLIFGSSEYATGVFLPALGGGSVLALPPPPEFVWPPEPEPSEPSEPSEPAEPNGPSPTPDEPEPSAAPVPSPSDEAQDDGTLKEVPPNRTPGPGFAVVVAAMAALAIGLRGRVGKGS